MAVICGPWRTDSHGGFRYRLCSGNAANEEPEAQPEPTPEPPAPPERTKPPAIERVVITDRTNDLARKLIDSVFHEGETS